ncbi:M-phase phosphoprotein 8 isoform X2 [Clupea harengus]|uniref:M-phase phosphoprotein 8 isoform X2 n=1 Tax=Clupea harengus TaxID=7950 RepID=A0A6P3WG83_CLUHA|nr:M-phase phosphoprotein 8 isoform X2 [Clupea harengus]
MASGAEKPEVGDSEQDEEEDVYEVERIIDMRVEEGEVLYRVRWKNYTADEDTWEPEAHLEDCREVLTAYKKVLAENKPKKDPSVTPCSDDSSRPTSAPTPQGQLPTKSDLFDADSDSSDGNVPVSAPIKKKKKKKKDEVEEEDLLVNEKKKKKKKKWKEEKPLPAPETDEGDDEEARDSPHAASPPSQPRKDHKAPESKRRLQESDDSDTPVITKKHKKDGKAKDGGGSGGKMVKKESVEDAGRKKKKKKARKSLESSEDEGTNSEVTTETQSLTNEDTADSHGDAKGKTLDKERERAHQKSESGGPAEVRAKQQQQQQPQQQPQQQKKSKTDLKLQGLKELMLDKKPKKPEGSSSAAAFKDKLKGLTSGAKSHKSPRGGSGGSSSNNNEDLEAKPRGKGLEPVAGPIPQRVPSSSSSSTSSSASMGAGRGKEEEGREEAAAAGGDKDKDRNASNLFEEFLLNCEAKDRVPRRQGLHTGAVGPEKVVAKSDKKTRPMKESPARRPDADKADKSKDASRSGQSPMTPESEAAMEALDQKEEPPARSKVDERKERAATEEEERRRKDRLEDRRTASETPASIDGADEASRWRERRRKRQDSESRLGMASDDNQETHDSLERPEKTPDRGQASLNLGVDIKLDWMTLEDFQKHLNGEDEILSAEPISPISPSELREAVKSGDYMAVKLAVASNVDYNLDQEDSSGMSLMMLAAAGGHDDILRLLIKKGVKVNGRQKNGSTALMHAAEKNFLTTVAILLEAGCHVNTQTIGGETALMKACKRGNADVVRLLLEYGADCNILSKHKNTAMHFAKISNNLVVYDLIKDHINTLSTVAEETIRAYFEARLALLEPVFPLACHRLCEGPDFSLDFNYKPPPTHNPGEGLGILLFIFHANFLSEITARLCGPCSVHAVVLNDKFQLPIFLDSHFIYSFSPVVGANKLFIRLAEAPTAKVKLLISAYRVQLK